MSNMPCYAGCWHGFANLKSMFLKRISALLGVFFAVFFAAAQPLAFPGAEGFGKHTTGGRGGKVFVVTNLNDSGAGSLRSAVERQGPRTVMFAVSGNIELRSPLRINNDSITIAGQSAPGDGICLKDCPLVINASNVIVRYIRVRVGDRYKHDSDAIGGGRYGQKNVILDHLTASWSIDECLSIYKTENLTVQWCMVNHSLSQSIHTKGAHGFGGIWGGFKATFHHNLLSNNSSRNPRFSSVDGTKWVDFRNNVVYNWGYKAAYGGGNHGEINMVGNYYKPGPATTARRLLEVAADGTGRYYVNGNVLEGDSAVTADNRLGVKDSKGLRYHRNRKSAGPQSGISPDAIPSEDQESETCLVSQPFPFEPINEDSPQDALRRVLAQVGCSHRRDSYDKDIIKQVIKGQGRYGRNGIIDSPADIGGWPKLKTGKPPLDTDLDGMPDRWERRNGLNPADPSDAAAYTLNSDYTNIEMYLNSLVSEP